MSASESSFLGGCDQASSCTNCGIRHVIYPLESEYVSIMFDPCPCSSYQKCMTSQINEERKAKQFNSHPKHFNIEK